MLTFFDVVSMIESILDEIAKLDFLLGFGVKLTDQEIEDYYFLKYILVLTEHHDACKSIPRLRAW